MHNHGHGETPTLTRQAVQATLHCLTGCAIGEVLGMVIATALGLGDAASIGLGDRAGVRIRLRADAAAGAAGRHRVPPCHARGLAADTVSIATMEVVDNAFILLVPGAIAAGLADGLFWWSLAVSLVIAFVLTVPVNRWLIARGRGHAVVHEFHHHPGTRRRDAPGRIRTPDLAGRNRSLYPLSYGRLRPMLPGGGLDQRPQPVDVPALGRERADRDPDRVPAAEHGVREEHPAVRVHRLHQGSRGVVAVAVLQAHERERRRGGEHQPRVRLHAGGELLGEPDVLAQRGPQALGAVAGAARTTASATGTGGRAACASRGSR